MTASPLSALAAAAGITVQWTDAFGTAHVVPDDTLRALLGALGLPAATEREIGESRILLDATAGEGASTPLLTATVGEPIVVPSSGMSSGRYHIVCEDGHVLEGGCTDHRAGRAILPPVDRAGYHHLTLGKRSCTLAAAPPRCFGVADALGRGRACGTAAQLYSLHRARSPGIGDYTALQNLAAATAPAGADFIAVSPVHALFAADATRFSPYAPSNRLFLNVLHIDAEALAALSSIHPEGTCRDDAAGLIDWPAFAAARMSLLRRQFDALSAQGLLAADQSEGQAFEAFRVEHGQALARHAGFEALHAAMLRDNDGSWHWRTWPAGFRDPESVETAAFMRDHAQEVAFHAFLQWRAHGDLAAAQSAARTAGMGIGLIADLAVGTDSGGSYAWGHQADLLSDVSVGAPPDLFNPLGQDWGLATFSPHALQRTGFAPFVNMLRAAMRHAGGVRIDHILGLQRLWLVPRGVASREGAYLAYPLQDMLRLVALESRRHRCVVVGEDLGTVPHGFRDILADANVLGTRVLWFERDGDGFSRPDQWNDATLATSSTHDLPTIAGWWAGRDIDWRIRLDLLGADETEAGLRRGREADRASLWQTLCDAGAAGGPLPGIGEAGHVIDAIAAFVGSTPCALAMLPLEDILGMVEQPNLPGTIDSHPNWRHRLAASVEHMMDEPHARARLEALAASRRRP